MSWLSWLWPFSKKAEPPAPPRAGGGDFVDAYRKQREPSARELLAELKHTAWACASINASVCASHTPRLYASTSPGEAEPRCATRPVAHKAVEATAWFTQKSAGTSLVEVTAHPLLSLLRQVNPVMNGFDLWEVTTLYLEVFGVAYWLLAPGPLGPPDAVWPLPSQAVRPVSGKGVVSHYDYLGAGEPQRLDAESVIAFRYPDPRDPYRGGLSPLRACYEQATLLSEFSAFRTAKLRNHAVPDAILSPQEILGEEERDRLERTWNQKMRRGGAGRVIVADQRMHLDLIQHSLGDLATLADVRATKEDIATAFGVPLPMLSTDTNLANLQAARELHALAAVRPRLRRRDEKLNERLVPLFDPTGRLLLFTDDPVPEDRSHALLKRNSGVRLGIITVNEARAEMGLPPREGGDVLNNPKLAPGPTPEEVELP